MSASTALQVLGTGLLAMTGFGVANRLTGRIVDSRRADLGLQEAREVSGWIQDRLASSDAKRIFGKELLTEEFQHCLGGYALAMVHASWVPVVAMDARWANGGTVNGANTEDLPDGRVVKAVSREEGIVVLICRNAKGVTVMSVDMFNNSVTVHRRLYVY